MPRRFRQQRHAGAIAFLDRRAFLGTNPGPVLFLARKTGVNGWAVLAPAEQDSQAVARTFPIRNQLRRLLHCESHGTRLGYRSGSPGYGNGVGPSRGAGIACSATAATVPSAAATTAACEHAASDRG